jgi:hypothetical protein
MAANAPASRDLREGAGAGQRWITPARVFFVVVLALVCVGWRVPTERYISPSAGIGYALGITGGSLMVLLLLYSARKRIRALRFLGSLSRWFEVHMVFGVLGPLCILYHANFQLGATNSNVAFVCMLTVAGSGLVGRYLYSRIHFGLHGRKKTLAELQVAAARLHGAAQSIPFLPDLAARLEASERIVLGSGPRLPVLELARPMVTAVRTALARWRLRRYVRTALRAAASQSPSIAAQRRRLRGTAFAFIDQRLRAARNVAEFEVFQRLFGLWHVLHLPLIFMMFAAGVVHVIAVHVY